MKKSGFYIIKDKFFEDTCAGIYWMIPMASKVDKYKKIIDKKARKVVAMLKRGVKFTPT